MMRKIQRPTLPAKAEDKGASEDEPCSRAFARPREPTIDIVRPEQAIVGLGKRIAKWQRSGSCHQTGPALSATPSRMDSPSIPHADFHVYDAVVFVVLVAAMYAVFLPDQAVENALLRLFGA
jgi:hypothetical protein